MTEDQLEQEALSWLMETGYRHVCGYDIAPDSADPCGEASGIGLVESIQAAIGPDECFLKDILGVRLVG